MLLTKRNKNREESHLADFDPFNTISLFDEMWPYHYGKTGDGEFSPPMDVSETENDYKVRLEVPGVEKDDIKIEYENGVLTLSGEKTATHEEKDERRYKVERRYGAFSRALRFRGVDEEKINAVFKNGVIEVTVPKLEPVKPKKIEVK